MTLLDAAIKSAGRSGMSLTDTASLGGEARAASRRVARRARASRCVRHGRPACSSTLANRFTKRDREDRDGWLSRGHMRAGAVACNTGMVLYVYVSYLASLDWGRFSWAGQLSSDRLLDHVLEGRHDEAFEKMRAFTFSESMLHNLGIFLLVGSAIAVVFFFLERERISWLQARLTATLSSGEAARVRWCLELYLWLLTLSFVSIVLLVPCHIEHPRAHYFVASNAFGFLSMCTYMALPLDLEALAKGEDKALAAWALHMSCEVRPVLKFVIGLHFATAGAGIVKCGALNDNRAALLFGIVETATVLGYQVFQMAFVRDDVLVKG